MVDGHSMLFLATVLTERCRREGALGLTRARGKHSRAQAKRGEGSAQVHLAPGASTATPPTPWPFIIMATQAVAPAQETVAPADNRIYIDTQHEDLVHDAQMDFYGSKLATCSSGTFVSRSREDRTVARVTAPFYLSNNSFSTQTAPLGFIMSQKRPMS
jgi:hypothetical protein